MASYNNMTTLFVDNSTGEEYEFLGTSISYSEKELLALEQEHDKEIDSFVQQLIVDGYFDEDWESEQEQEQEEEEGEETGTESETDIESESDDETVVNMIENEDEDEYNKENKCISAHFNVKSQINLNKNVPSNYTSKESKISSFHNNQIPLHSIHCFTANTIIFSMQMKIKGLYIDNLNMVN